MTWGAAILSLVLMTGCIHLEQTFLLNGDGSLVVTYHYSIADDSANVVAKGQQSIEKWQGKPLSQPPQWLASRAAMQRHFDASGVRLQAYDTEVKGGRRHITMTVFAEDGPAAINQGLFGAMRCERISDTRVRLSAQMPEIPGAEDPAKRKAIAALCDDLYLKLEFKLPTDVLASTAHRQKKESAVWVFEPSEESDFLTELPVVECEFDAGRLQWTADLPAPTPSPNP